MSGGYINAASQLLLPLYFFVRGRERREGVGRGPRGMRESVGDWRKGEPEKAEDVRNSNWLKSKLNARVVGREANKQEWMVGWFACGEKDS